MNGMGTAERIFTAPDAGVEMVERSDVEAVAGRGLRGDRYFSDVETGTFVTWDADDDRGDGYDLTLIEQEAIEAIEREAGIELAPGSTDGTSSRGTSRSTTSSARGSASATSSAGATGCVNPVATSRTSPGRTSSTRWRTEAGFERTSSKPGQFAPETESRRSTNLAARAALLRERQVVALLALHDGLVGRLALTGHLREHGGSCRRSKSLMASWTRSSHSPQLCGPRSLP